MGEGEGESGTEDMIMGHPTPGALWPLLTIRYVSGEAIPRREGGRQGKVGGGGEEHYEAGGGSRLEWEGGGGGGDCVTT